MECNHFVPQTSKVQANAWSRRETEPASQMGRVLKKIWPSSEVARQIASCFSGRLVPIALVKMLFLKSLLLRLQATNHVKRPSLPHAKRTVIMDALSSFASLHDNSIENTTSDSSGYDRGSIYTTRSQWSPLLLNARSIVSR